MCKISRIKNYKMCIALKDSYHGSLLGSNSCYGICCWIFFNHTVKKERKKPTNFSLFAVLMVIFKFLLIPLNLIARDENQAKTDRFNKWKQRYYVLYGFFFFLIIIIVLHHCYIREVIINYWEIFRSGIHNCL